MTLRPRRRILFVCTANICRSPTAELLARYHFGEEDFVFRSAGFLRPDRPCAEEIVALLQSAGIDARPHRSYQIDPASIEVAELILTMEGSHVQKVTSIAPEAFVKTVPLKEAAVVLEQIPSEVVSIEEVLSRLAEGREPRSYLDGTWDVEDPYGGKARAYRQAVTEIDELVRTVISRLY